MIQITHKQAHRLIREALDTTLPGEQWAVLQGHLETCPECRAYQARLQGSETSLRRLTRSRWANAGGPQEPTFAGVQRYRQQRVERARLARQAAAFLVVAVLILVLLRVQAAAQPRPEPTAIPPTAGPSPTPGKQINPDAFQGVVVFSAQRTAGESLDGDLFMLTAGPQGVEVQPLTSGPANDTDPVWSPDGNWIAYLSNQDRLEKNDRPIWQDIYVMSVAGTHRTRLTNDQNYYLRGPLSWSADGQWLAVAARDRNSVNRMIYLVPVGRNALDDPGGRTLPGQPFDMTNPQFSPQGARLAYFASGGDLTAPEIHQLDLKTSLMSIRAYGEPGKNEHLTGAFDWGWNGTDLVYTLIGQKPELRTSLRWSLFPADPLVLDSGLLWGPDGNLVYLSSYKGKVGPYECTLLVGEGQVIPGRIEPGLFTQPTPTPLASEDTSRGSPLPDKQPHLLCLTGPSPNRSAWGHEYKKDWLVVTGWTENALKLTPTAAQASDPSTREPASAVYAVTYPLVGPLTGGWQKLADLPEGYIPGRLAVRPNGAPAEIHPVAVEAQPKAAAQQGNAAQPETTPAKPDGNAGNITRTPGAPQTADLPPADLLARIFGISLNGQVLRVSSNDKGLKVNLPAPMASDENVVYYGAALSPHGQQAAVIYTSNGWRSEVFVYTVAALDLGDQVGPGSLIQVTARARRTYRPEADWIYDRLAWSPDGKRIAALMHTESDNASGYALQIINMEQPSRGSMTSLGSHILPDGAHPLWTPDGREVLLPVNQNQQDMAGVIAVNVTDGNIRVVTQSDGYDIVSDAAVAPDGSAVAYFALTTYPLRMDPPHDALFQLRVAGLAQDSFIQPLSLPGYNPEVPNTGYGWLQWRIDSEGSKHLMFLRRNGPLAFAKTEVYDFPVPKTSAVVAPATLSTLYQIPDEIISAAWSPDGKWLIYSTQAGTFLLDLRVDGKAADPVFLAPIVCTGLDWR